MRIVAKYSRLVVLVTSVVVSSACFSAEAQRKSSSNQGASVQETARSLESSILRLMREGDVPGLSIVLISNGRISWHRGFGVKNADTKAPISDNTVFEAASLSKPVFAYAVLKLVDSGKLELDKPLIDYLPEPYLADERVRLITARMALDHTTGFQNEVLPGRPLKIYFTPGEKFSYSGEGFLYLQKVVERITSERLDVFMARTVFEPLQMTDSSFVWQDRYEALKANGHKASGAVGQMRKPVLPRSASGLHTTALDYAKFVIAVMNGTGLRKDTMNQMVTAQVRVDETCSNCIERSFGRPSKALLWGLGWGLERTAAGDAIWHWGDNSSEFHNFVIAYPKQKTGVVILSNSGNGFSIIPELVSQITGHSHPAFAWMGYEAYNSPAKLLFKDILQRGITAITQYRALHNTRRKISVLNEAQVNGVGYWLLGKKRIEEAVEIFKMNVEDFPNSANAYDSLGEAYMTKGDKELSIKNYKRSLELNPNNANAVENLRRLQYK